MQFGDILAEVLEDHDVTQKDLAAKLSLSPATIGNYVHNLREPDFHTLKTIADIFEVSVDYLLGHEVHGTRTGTPIIQDEERLLYFFRNLSKDNKILALEFCKLISRLSGNGSI